MVHSIFDVESYPSKVHFSENHISGLGGAAPPNFYSKSDSHSVYRDSSYVSRNKCGEVRSSDLGDLDVESYPLKVHFSEDHISAPRRCCVPKFLHALENHQVLLAHPPSGTAAPFTTFLRGVKNWLKM